MNCSWCGGWEGVREMRTHSTTMTRCNSQSPFDPSVRCRRARGHLGKCIADAAQQGTWLCFRCWGVFRESGERPPRYRMRDPDVGPITGTPLDLRRRA